MNIETTVRLNAEPGVEADDSKSSPLMIAVSPDLARSPALQRLLEEVANEEEMAPHAAKYNRQHNRHNRH